VGLPDVLKKDLTKVPPPASAQEIAEALKKAADDAKEVKPVKLPKDVKSPEKEVADKDDMVLKPKKVVKKEETDNAKPDKAKARASKNKSALDRIKALSKIAAEESEAKPSAVVKGNKVSKGTSLSGDAKEGEANYLDAVRSLLQENWELPVWLARQNLSAHVQIRIDGQGRVRSYVFVKASGNAQFDAAIKKTIAASQPLPRPTEDVAASMLIDGILVKFPL
jgi:TonB family protein